MKLDKRVTARTVNDDIDARNLPFPNKLSKADEYLWDLTDKWGNHRRWRSDKFCTIPEMFKMPVARSYRKFWEDSEPRDANSYLLNISNLFSSSNIKLGIDEDQLDLYAKRRSDNCRRIRAKSDSDQEAYDRITAVVKRLGFTPPLITENTTLIGAINRFTDKIWWRRKARDRFREEFEAAAIKAGMVHSKAGIYVSDESLYFYCEHKRRNNTLLEKLIAINEYGEFYTLAELANLSVSNPKNRRNELMARLHGFDLSAKRLGHRGIFISITCPSRMHPRYRKSGDPNPKYDGTTPNQAQKYLCKCWSRIRAKLKNSGIHIYGFRVAEPQHDATPHWHLLIYSAPSNIQTIIDTCRRYALLDSPDEPGAAEHRVKTEYIDWSKGTGASYLAKYISKNIDGAHLDKDLYGKDAKQAAIRVTAWASIHKIRQFQQFGGPAVTCWRELRRISEAPDGIMEEARVAADDGDWSEFTRLLGGVETDRKHQELKILRIYDETPGRYGDPIGMEIKGVTDGQAEVFTRLYNWTISKAPNVAPNTGPAG